MAVDKNGKQLPKGITQRPDGRYMARFEYQGEKYTMYDKDLRVLKKKLAERKYEVEHGIYAKEDKVTIASWFDTWMKEYKENSVKAGTLQTYREVFTNCINPTLGKKRLKDVRPEMIQKLINDLFNQGYSKTRINAVHILLLGMYKQAIKNGLIKSNPSELVTFPKFKKGAEKRVMSLGEQNMFLEYAKDSSYYDIYLLALSTGMRIGELLGLEWSDVNLRNRTINVTGTLVYLRDGRGMYKDTPKTASSFREIPMLDNVETVLRNRRMRQFETRVALGDKWKPSEGLENLVFTSGEGKALWYTSIRGNMSKIVKNIQNDGIQFDDITPHTFRHTFATRGLENGIQPKVMQTILGHSTLAMTMDLYSHVLPDMKAEEMKKIANLF